MTGFNIHNDFVIGNTGGKIIRFDHTGSSTGQLSGTITNNETGDTNFRIEVGNSETLTIAGQVTGAGGLFLRANNQANQGTFLLNNATTDFTGNLGVSTNVEVASIANAGVASHAGAGRLIVLGSSANALATTNNNQDGNLIYTGGAATTDKQIQVGNYWFSSGNNGGNGGNGGSGARTLGPAGSYTAGTNTITGVIQDNNATDAFDDETVSVNVSGSNWALKGDSTYTGTTVVTGNSTALFINGNSSAATGDVNIGTGSDTPTFGGTGTVGGNTTINAGAIHTVGTTTSGQQTFSNNLTYDKGATVSWNLISNSTSSSEFDQFAVGGSIGFTNNTGTGDLILNINFGGDFDDTFWQNGANTNEWEIWDGTIASLAGIDFTIQLSGDSTGANLQYFDSNAFEIANDNFGMTDTGTGIWLQQIAPIPEPSTYALMSLALAAFGWVTRQRRG